MEEEDFKVGRWCVVVCLLYVFNKVKKCKLMNIHYIRMNENSLLFNKQRTKTETVSVHATEGL